MRRSMDDSPARALCAARVLVALLTSFAGGCGMSGDDPSDWLANHPIGQIFSAALGDALARTDFPLSCGPGVLGIVVPDCPLGGACFTEACDTHNLCYGTCGTTRETCDEQLLHDMQSVCTLSFARASVLRAECLALALAYADVTRDLGGASFLNSQAACSRPEDAANRSIIHLDGARVYYAVEREGAQLSVWMVDADTGEMMRIHQAPGETVVRRTADHLIIARETAGLSLGNRLDLIAETTSGSRSISLWDRAFEFTPGRFLPAVDGDRVAWVIGGTLEVYDLSTEGIVASVSGGFSNGLVESLDGDMAVVVGCPRDCDRAWLVDLAGGDPITLPFEVRIGDHTFDLGIFDGARATRDWLLVRAFSERDAVPVTSILAFHVPTQSWRVLADYAASAAGVLELTDTDALLVEHDKELWPRSLTLRLERVALSSGIRTPVADLSEDRSVWGIGSAFDSVAIPAVVVRGDRVFWIDERGQELVVHDLAEQANWTVPLEGFEFAE